MYVAEESEPSGEDLEELTPEDWDEADLEEDPEDITDEDLDFRLPEEQAELEDRDNRAAATAETERIHGIGFDYANEKDLAVDYPQDRRKRGTAEYHGKPTRFWAVWEEAGIVQYLREVKGDQFVPGGIKFVEGSGVPDTILDKGGELQVAHQPESAESVKAQRAARRKRRRAQPKQGVSESVTGRSSFQSSRTTKRYPGT